MVGGEESDATELAEARASLRSVATDSEFAQDLRGRRQAELEDEMRLLARDRGVQIARRRKRLKDRPAATAQSDVANALGAFLDSCVAEAATEEGERRELKRQQRETKRKQRAANAAKALSRGHARPLGRAANQRELAAASGSARTATAAAAATIPKAHIMSEPEPTTRLRPWVMSRKGWGRA